jgi:DNA (cytosine-5)-methyltransferase 1
MIRIGTDCSGIEAPIQALKRMGIPFRHMFSCEKDIHCQESIQANYHPEQFDTDITTRHVRSLPAIDLYVCGFPCQPFSLAGKRQGVEDDRGTIFGYCLEVIHTLRPKCFILENVKGLLNIDDGRTFDAIITSLKRLKYHITWKVLNTKDYGIPQQRERLYIIGLLSDIPYIWPEPIKMKSLPSYLDHTDREPQPIPEFMKRANMLKHVPQNSCFVDIGFPYHDFPNSDIVCPCITAQANLWCVPYQRRATVKECLALQGFPKNFIQVVSDRQLKKQIGNSMSVNVLEAIFSTLLPILYP